MKNVFYSLCLAIAALVCIPSLCFAADVPEIYNRTDYGTFWRYDFRYPTTDGDGKPITLSAAIFMHKDVQSKKKEAKGCILLNHFTITSDKDRPTNVSELQHLEPVLAMTKYVVIESDGIGFGLTKDLPQPYLQGRVLGKVDIDAFLAGRKLLDGEGYIYGSTVLNMGYSQGGYVGAWVDRLVSEGYRSDELPKINYTFIGGGSYDIYATYLDIIKETVSHYPVALPLVLSDIVTDESTGVKYSDVLTQTYLEKIQEWFECKEYNTDSINAMAYTIFNSTPEAGISTSLLFTPELWDPNSDIVANHIRPWMEEHSLTYDDWMPTKTDTVTLVHSVNDEVVAFVNVRSLSQHYKRMGFTRFDVDSTFTGQHTPTGSSYAMKAVQVLSKYTPKEDGVTAIRPVAQLPEREGIYSLDGRLLYSGKASAAEEAALSKGIYIVNGRKVVR